MRSQRARQYRPLTHEDWPWRIQCTFSVTPNSQAKFPWLMQLWNQGMVNMPKVDMTQEGTAIIPLPMDLVDTASTLEGISKLRAASTLNKWLYGSVCYL